MTIPLAVATSALHCEDYLCCLHKTLSRLKFFKLRFLLEKLQRKMPYSDEEVD